MRNDTIETAKRKTVAKENLKVSGCVGVTIVLNKIKVFMHVEQIKENQNVCCLCATANINAYKSIISDKIGHELNNADKIKIHRVKIL